MLMLSRRPPHSEVDAAFGELLTVLSKIDYLLAHGEAAIAPETRPGNLLLLHKRSQVSRGCVSHKRARVVRALIPNFHNFVSRSSTSRLV